MRPFLRDGKSGKGRGDKKFDRKNTGGRTFGSRDSAKPGMFTATCSECGNSCEVPFKPTGRKPILCDRCFKKDGSSPDRKPFRSQRESRGEPSTYRGRNADREGDELKKINAKLDAILRILS
jgi:CxxC-x17-CxxC domain-containing protein